MHAPLRLYYGNLIITGLRNWDFANGPPVLSESRDIDILWGMRCQLAICEGAVRKIYTQPSDGCRNYTPDSYQQLVTDSEFCYSKFS